jgi:hypothetical protein
VRCLDVGKALVPIVHAQNHTGLCIRPADQRKLTTPQPESAAGPPASDPSPTDRCRRATDGSDGGPPQMTRKATLRRATPEASAHRIMPQRASLPQGRRAWPSRSRPGWPRAAPARAGRGPRGPTSGPPPGSRARPKRHAEEPDPLKSPPI